MTEHLFVYGTLRRASGHAMAQLLARQARFVGEARAAGRLFDLGAYPAMTAPLTAEDWVTGDVFELDNAETTLAALDRYEGCSDRNPLFKRTPATVTFKNGDVLAAWVYWYCSPVRPEQHIPTGEYRYECE